jgi:hypothetical protein
MYVGSQQKDWDIYLPFMEFAYNTSIHPGTKETPFYLMYGRDPKLPIEVKLGGTASEDFAENMETYKQTLVHGFKEVYERIRYETDKERQKQEARYNKGQVGSTFKEGDLVWYFSPQRTKGVSMKLKHPWQGPFRITKVMGPLNVEITSLDNRNRPAEIVHITKLKQYKKPFDFNKDSQEVKVELNNEIQEQQPRPNEDEEEELQLQEQKEEKETEEVRESEYEVEAIEGQRRRNGQREYLVKWKNYEERTWEKESNLDPLEILAEFRAANRPHYSLRRVNKI